MRYYCEVRQYVRESFTFEQLLYRAPRGMESVVAVAASTPHIPADADFDRGGYVDVGVVNSRWNAIYGDDSTFNNPPHPNHTSVTFSPQVKVTHFDPNLSTLEVVTATHYEMGDCGEAN